MSGSDLPPLNALRAFEAAARRGSFAAAADDLNVTYWAIGKQVRQLEDWLGLPLFERRRRGVALTDEGAELLEGVTEAFARLTGAVGRLRPSSAPRRVSGTVRINVPTSFALRWLMPRLPEFQRAFPQIDVRISATSRKLRYIGAAADLGVRLNWDPLPGFEAEILMPDRQLPACNPEVLRARPLETVDDLRRHTLLHSATTRSAWPRWLAAAGRAELRPARQLEFEHVHLQLQAAVDGLGIAMASKALIERDIAAGRLVCPIAAPELDAGNYLLVRDARDETAASRAFRAWIVTAARGAAAIG